jgi:hypothetical protein
LTILSNIYVYMNDEIFSPLVLQKMF